MEAIVCTLIVMTFFSYYMVLYYCFVVKSLHKEIVDIAADIGPESLDSVYNDIEQLKKIHDEVLTINSDLKKEVDNIKSALVLKSTFR